MERGELVRRSFIGVIGVFAILLIVSIPGAAVADSSLSWDIENVYTPPSNVGSLDSSIAVDSSGNPHMVCHDAAEDNLKYFYLEDGQWMKDTIPAPSSDFGKYCSIALDTNDNPHISYYDIEEEGLVYAWHVGGDWNIATVDTGEGNDVGQYSSIALDSDDKAHISYYDDTDWDLKHARQKTSWYDFDTTTVDSAGDVGRYSSIAIDSNDNIYISYYDASNTNLKYAISDDEGTTWTKDYADENSNNVGLYSSIDIAEGSGWTFPYISYYDSTDKNLKLATAFDVNWVIDGSSEVGRYTSIAIDDNFHISYYDSANTALKYASGTTDDWNLETVDYEDEVGKNTSIALDSNGSPHISYFDSTNDNFKYTTPLEVPTLVSMPDPTDTDTFHFDWSDVTGANKYHLQLDNNPEFSNPFEAYPLFSEYNYEHNYDDDNYYWRVSAVDTYGRETDFSDTDNFTFDNQPPSIPNLLSPANDETTTNHTPTFDWENSTDASSFTYRLVVDNDLNFADGENSIDESGLTDSIYTLGSDLPDDNYYWKVSAEDELGHQSDWSSTWHLEIYTPNHPPNLSSGSVSPNSDNVGSTFTYEVTYQDDDGDEPDYVTVYIDGESHAMSKISGTPTDGATYQYEWTTSSGDDGSHTYYFKTSDGTDTARLPSAPNTYDGPQVTKTEKHAPTLSSGSVSPDSDNAGATFTYQVTYQDEDNDAPDSIEVIIDEVVKTMENIEDNSYTEGVVYQYEWTTTSDDVGQHTYYFEASDGTYQARLPETDNYEGPNVTKTSENVDNLNVSGYVKSDGGAVEGATVTIGEKSDTTDSDGFFEVENLEGGKDYDVSVDASGYESYSETFSLGNQDKTLEDIILKEPSGGTNVLLIAAIVIAIGVVVGSVIFLKREALMG